jgi:hypothetical protein
MRAILFLLPAIAAALPITVTLSPAESIANVANDTDGDHGYYSGVEISIDLEPDVKTRVFAGTVSFEARPLDWTGYENISGYGSMLAFTDTVWSINGLSDYGPYAPTIGVSGDDHQTRGSVTREVAFRGIGIASYYPTGDPLDMYFDLGDRWRLTFKPVGNAKRIISEGESFTENVYTDMLLTRAAPIPEPGTAILGVWGLLLWQILRRFRASRRDARYPPESW